MPGRAARIRLAVVGPQRQHIVAAGPHRRGRIEAEAREGAFVAAELDPVQPDVGDDARRLEFEEAALARSRRAAGAAIPAHAAIAVERRVAGRAAVAE